MSTVSRNDVRTMLQGWLQGDITRQAVHDWATDRFAVSDYESEDDVLNEVLQVLDMLDIDLLNPSDIPSL
jgi:hypothetical protein